MNNEKQYQALRSQFLSEGVSKCYLDELEKVCGKSTHYLNLQRKQWKEKQKIGFVRGKSADMETIRI